MRFPISLPVLAIALTWVPVLHAQNYPARPIRLIVPGSPGAGADVPARIMAQALGEDPGWRVVVENRPGASGRIGTELVAKAPPDGYTLLLGASTWNAVAHAAPNLPYDTLRDFAPISVISTNEFTLVAHPSLPVRTVKDVITLARARPGEIRFSSVGNLSGAHVTGELLKQLAKINIAHVPYKGGGPATIAVLSGEVDLYFGSGPSVTPHAKTGRLRLIATTGVKRSRFFPELPTVAETVPGHAATLWYGVLAPAATPKDILARLHAAIYTAGRTPKLVGELTAVGQDAAANTPEEFAAYIKAEIAKWSKVVKISGATAD